MKKKTSMLTLEVVALAVAALLLFWSKPIEAEVVMPATSDNIQDFDKLLAKQRSPQAAVAQRADAIGRAVSAEANRLQQVSAQQKINFGRANSRINTSSQAPSSGGGSGGGATGALPDSQSPVHHGDEHEGHGHGHGHGHHD